MGCQYLWAESIAVRISPVPRFGWHVGLSHWAVESWPEQTAQRQVERVTHVKRDRISANIREYILFVTMNLLDEIPRNPGVAWL